MHSHDDRLRVYKELADWYDRQRQPQMRDRFLVLAADAALAAGQADEAERLRQRLMQVNPHHLLKPYHSFAEALEAPDVQTYVNDLRVNYPLDVAEDLLRSLREGERPAPAPPSRGPAPAPAKPPLPPTSPVIHMDDSPTSPLGAGLGGDDPTYFDGGAGPDLNLEATAAPPAARRGPPARPEPPAPTLPPPGPSRRPAGPLRPLAPRAGASAPPPRGARPTAPRPPAPRRPAALPAAPSHHPSLEDPAAEGGGGWFGAVLFVLASLVGLALAAYTFARPYLPEGWLAK